MLGDVSKNMSSESENSEDGEAVDDEKLMEEVF